MSISIHAPDPSGSFGKPLNPDWVPDAAAVRGAEAITREFATVISAADTGAIARALMWCSFAFCTFSLALIWLARWAQRAYEPYPNQSLGIASLNIAATLVCLGMLTKDEQRVARFACCGFAALAGFAAFLTFIG